MITDVSVLPALEDSRSTSTGGLVQHDLYDCPASGGQQFGGYARSSCASVASTSAVSVARAVSA